MSQQQQQHAPQYPHQPPHPNANAPSSNNTAHSSMSSASSSSSHQYHSRHRNSSSPMSTIESTVTRLLVATKQLLESLTQWARGDASEQDVSDVYVVLGNEFNVACRAFLSAGVEVADLGDVPQALRVILEKALSEDASQENLDRYLPSIREIIVNLLRQLKQKQTIIRANAARQQQQQQQQQQHQSHQHTQRYQANPNARGGSGEDHPRQHSVGSESSKTSTTSSHDQPKLLHPQPQQPQQYPTHQQPQQQLQQPSGQSLHERNETDPPPPVPPQEEKPTTPRPSSPTKRKDNNALVALQRGEALERRASRRFSAYQFAKLTNSQMPGSKEAVPDLPPLPPSSSRTSFLPTKSPQSSAKAEYTTSSATSSPRPESSFMNQSPEIPQRASQQFIANENEIALYLQIGRQVKKSVVQRGEITIPALRLLFIDKFAYSPGADTFPDIYIQDPHSGIRYELDETTLDDVKQGSLLSLNIEVMDEVKKHIDDGLAVLQKSIDDLNAKIEDNSTAISSLNNVKRGSTNTVEKERVSSVSSTKAMATGSNKELANLRKDLSVVRQISSESYRNLKEQALTMLQKLQKMDVVSGSNGSRTYMESCHKKLSGDTDRLLTSVDDLQDIIEGLRKDVAQRGVRPAPKQLQYVAKEIAQAKSGLTSMEQYIHKERPSWKKIWEKELDTVCEEQQFFKLQEELVADLTDDLEKAEETFSLVEQCSNVQQTSARPANQPFFETTPVDGIVHAKDAVLGEVAALQPNHEQRVEAIERAEKLRKKELEMRGVDAFKEELGEFVAENKLKKSGGIEETERRRKIREQKMLEEQRKNDEEARLLREQERQRKREEKKKKDKKDKKPKKKKDKLDLEDDESNTNNNDNDELNEQVESGAGATTPTLDDNEDPPLSPPPQPPPSGPSTASDEYDNLI